MKKQEIKKTRCPFVGPDGLVHSPLRAILDRCIIWPTPAPDRIGAGIIEIPESIRGQFQDSTGILLSVGPGYWGEDVQQGPILLSRAKLKKPGNRATRQVWHPTTDQLKPGVLVYYDNTVPWGTQALGLDGKMYNLVICTVQDIQGIVS